MFTLPMAAYNSARRVSWSCSGPRAGQALFAASCDVMAVPSAGSVLLILDVAYWRGPGALLASGGRAGDGDDEERHDEHRDQPGARRVRRARPDRARDP